MTIYSDLRGYIRFSETGNVEVVLVDSNGSKYNPNLIIPNLLDVEKVKNFLEEVLKKYKYGKTVKLKLWYVWLKKLSI